VQGIEIATIAREIVRLSQLQLDLLEAVPVHKWTETQQDAYRLRQQRISTLSTKIGQLKLSDAA
jgi:hypothetical protein